eukprot:TRINITY_DN18783_c0_g1_i1.p1 TRINITY_DN18783_c0_g1~~TRINITY_DN18783_c0_g1_i1.p1  ORF type:complete len:336 (-),score=69.53 TRINITY_DN18783_c0_g1_i1:36-1043(-)
MVALSSRPLTGAVALAATALCSTTSLAAVADAAAGGLPTPLLAWADRETSRLLAAQAAEPAAWPDLFKADLQADAWDSGLNEPHVYVVSVPAARQRRVHFASEFRRLGMRTAGVWWVPAIDGRAAPAELLHGNGSNGDEAALRYAELPGVLGCYLSHLAALRWHLRRFPDSDMLVLEDDVGFHPDFRSLWGEFAEEAPDAVEVEGSAAPVPVATWHFGGHCFWAPSVARGKSYIHATWVDRTWGYVVRAWAVAPLLAYMQRVDPGYNVGFDQMLSGVTMSRSFPVLTPQRPLALGLGKKSGSANALLENDGLLEPDWYKRQCWSVCGEATLRCSP